MATDIEESDTDDHDRPAPPKRQRTRCIKVDEGVWESEKQVNEDQNIEQEQNVEYDDIEKHARDKLKRWQACQVAKGFVDNTVNRMLEIFAMSPLSDSLEESRFRLFRGNDMENTAVMMAIWNHGLVQSGEFVSQPNEFYDERTPGYWTNNDMSCSYPTNDKQDTEEFSNSMAATSVNSLRLNNSTEMPKYSEENWDVNKPVDSNQREDFLERAVAEAIKKKGLSTLSVDYG